MRFVHYIVLAAMLAVIAGAVWLLYLAVWEPGVAMSGDGLIYMQSGTSLAHSGSVSLRVYDHATDEVGTFYVTHYPPMMAIVYALGIWLGMPTTQVPALAALCSWGALLVGIAVLTVRLSGSLIVALLAVLLSVLSPIFWLVYTHAFPEMLFLPLLVWLMVVLVDLPSGTSYARSKYLLAVVLLMLLMLVRYEGIFVFGIVLLWWTGWRVAQQRIRRLPAEYLLFGLAAVPLALWLIRNQFVAQNIISDHLSSSPVTGQRGIVALARDMVRVVLPVAPPEGFLHLLGWGGLAVFGVASGAVAIAGIVLFWQNRSRWSRDSWRVLLRSPAPLWMVCYIVLYGVVQAFFSFGPSRARYITSFYALAVPWGFALVTYIGQRRGVWLLAAYVALIGVLIGSPLAIRGLPEWVSLDPPRIEYPNNAGTLQDALARYPGTVGLLVAAPPRSRDLPTLHSELFAWLNSFDSDVVVIAGFRDNPPFLAYPHFIAVEDAPRRGHISHGVLGRWLGEGTCTSQHTTVAVVMHPDTEEGIQRQQRIEEKCPDLPMFTFPHSVAYVLEDT
jgi:hypothetical protein